VRVGIRRWLAGALLWVVFGTQVGVQSPSLDRELVVAAAKGDVTAVGQLVRKGANVNADYRGLTALQTAADQGNLALVRLLLDLGADVNTRDFGYGKSPLRIAAVPYNAVGSESERAEIVRLLIDKGAGTEGEALTDLIRARYFEAVRTVVNRGGVYKSYLNTALAAAQRAKQPDLVALLTEAGAKEPTPQDSPQSPERMKAVAGVYRNGLGQELILRTTADHSELVLERAGKAPLPLVAVDLTMLRSFDLKTAVQWTGEALPPTSVVLRDEGRSETFTRAADLTANPANAANSVKTAAVERPTSASPASSPTAVPTPWAREWPSFRGPRGSGVMDGADVPTTWDATKGLNITWKTAIPGLAHSSPVVWGNRVFITTAVAKGDAPLVFQVDTGDELGRGASVDTKDPLPHSWRVYALDKRTGKILWQRVTFEGIPRTRRHVEATQANSTPATDGQHLVVFFGSEGLYCYSVEGKLLWKKDFGPLASGRFSDPGYEWNTASSPIIYKNLAIIQVDVVDSSFLAAFDLKTGKEMWRVTREEFPTWTTPLIYEGPPRPELITAGSLYARGYDPETGKELWRLGKHAEVATPTPIAAHGLVFITSGFGAIQPIYAVRPGAAGDITLTGDGLADGHVVWSHRRGGTATPTPIVYGDLLYVCSNNGILRAYHVATGEQVYQVRVGQGGSYTASPVAADGKLFLASEDGDVAVVKAGPKFELLSVNRMGEVVMATPAISEGMIIFRTQHHVLAAGSQVKPAVSSQVKP
jgi:outer membrane protein assembly factor BamB